MSIRVNREGNPDETINMTISIATTQFFNEYWEKAIEDMNIVSANGSVLVYRTIGNGN